MLFYTNKEFHGSLKKQVDSLVGPKYTFKEQSKNGFSGSPLLRLLKVNMDKKQIDGETFNVRCNIEKRIKGLIISLNYKYKLLNIAIDYLSIEKVIIVKNEECINPLPYSLMNILMKAGLHVRYARYFRLITSEYSIQRMDLLIQIKDGYINFDSHGYNYYEMVDYFTSSSLYSKIEIVNKTCVQQRV